MKVMYKYCFFSFENKFKVKRKNEDMLNDFYEIYVSEKDGRF